MKDDLERWYFTFGCGQEHNGRYIVLAGTLEGTREEMVARFGTRWSMQYGAQPGEELAKKWGWAELTGLDAMGAKAQPGLLQLGRAALELERALVETRGDDCPMAAGRRAQARRAYARALNALGGRTIRHDLRALPSCFGKAGTREGYICAEDCAVRPECEMETKEER